MVCGLIAQAFAAKFHAAHDARENKAPNPKMLYHTSGDWAILYLPELASTQAQTGTTGAHFPRHAPRIREHATFWPGNGQRK